MFDQFGGSCPQTFVLALASLDFPSQVIADQLEARGEAAELINGAPPLLVGQIEFFHDRRLFHHPRMRFILGYPLHQLPLAGSHRKRLGRFMNGSDDHALEVVERGGAQKDARDNALDVFETTSAAGEREQAGQLSELATRLILENLAVSAEREGFRDGDAELRQMARQVRRLNQAARIAKKVGSIRTIDEAIADTVALTVRMDDRQHAAPPPGVLEDHVGRLRGQVVAGELVVVLVTLNDLGRGLAEEEREEAQQGGFARRVFARDGDVTADVEFDGFPARVGVDQDEAQEAELGAGFIGSKERWGRRGGNIHVVTSP